MGKLHKISRAFDKLPDSTKRDIWFNKQGCRFNNIGQVVFTNYWREKKSYQNFIAKIAEEWIVKFLASRQNDGVALRD